ncbi:glycosyltransferase family 2 protein [Halomonas sp. M4R1S46]|uniref:glycosyltransferase family 2 protein n=1 Tax=Halomonas sp. M4R1S46 TaxID=2982692 RepID=UPI0021E4EC92|nr:glycosyltransferase family 2 protein [Halomonas sp. M4R1S46]UYG06326.1 glycosyltransferase [Halomonas sp. M4R1S46]
MDVSIVIPSYKSVDYIYRAVKSCVDEAVPTENIIVVEDGVFDDTGKVLSEFPNIHHIALPQNRGGGHARNVGLHVVKTTYVLFLDSDDFLYGGLVKGLLVNACKKKSDITYGPWRYEGEGVKDNSILYPVEKSNILWMRNWLKGEFFPPCSILWKKDFLYKIGGWNEALKANQDGELAFRALSKEPSIAISHAGCGVYWRHDAEHRVSRSPKRYRVLANDVIYNVIDGYISCKSSSDILELKSSLGVFCCANAWTAYAEVDDDYARQWLKRAKKYGYEDAGYSRATNVIGTLLGVRRGAKFRSSLTNVGFISHVARFVSGRLNF